MSGGVKKIICFKFAKRDDKQKILLLIVYRNTSIYTEWV
jgi:hypothetical protein